MVEERDKMKAQIAKMLENEIDIKLMGQNYDEKVISIISFCYIPSVSLILQHFSCLGELFKRYVANSMRRRECLINIRSISLYLWMPDPKIVLLAVIYSTTWSRTAFKEISWTGTNDACGECFKSRISVLVCLCIRTWFSLPDLFSHTFLLVAMFLFAIICKLLI